MADMIEILRQEHASMVAILDLIDQEVNGPGDMDLGLLHEVMEYCLTYPDQYHHPKEDLIYQALCRHDPSIAPAIDDLEAEHEELAIATREVAALVEQAAVHGAELPRGFDTVVRSFLDLYRQHIRKEEAQFFPTAARMLSPEEWSEVESQVTDPTDPLFRQASADRLRSLLNRDAS